MISNRRRIFAYAKIASRQKIAHRPNQCRRLWHVDIDTAVATHCDGWTLNRFQKDWEGVTYEQAAEDFKFKLSLLSEKELAEFIDEGLAALKSLGL